MTWFRTAMVLGCLCGGVASAWAQGPVTKGENHQGSLSGASDSDAWTFTANAGDRVVVSVLPEVNPPSGFSVSFQSTTPNGQDWVFTTGSRTQTTAPMTGTYTLTARTGPLSTGTATYSLRVFTIPGSFMVPAGDEGGALSDGGTVSGVITRGDIDLWTFAGCAGARPRIELREVPPSPGNGFNPSFSLYGPTGQLVQQAGDNDELDITLLPMTATGEYTVVTYSGVPSHDGTDHYTLRVSGMCATGPTPVGVSDAYVTAVNTPLTVPAPGVLANDSSPGGLTMTSQVVSNPAHGTLTLQANGSFTYTPDAGYTGLDAFQYRPVTTNGAGNVTSVNLTVSGATTVQAPADLFVANVTGNNVTLQWSPPTLGPVPTGYLLEAGLAPGGTIATFPLPAAPVFAVAAPNGLYYVRVKSTAGNQTSDASNEVLLNVNVPAPPSAPLHLLGTAAGASLALAWKNTFAGGAPGSLVLDVTGAVTTSILLGLTDVFTYANVPPGTYTLSLRAINGAGSSGSSNAVTLTFPQGCSGPPLPPTQVTGYRIGSTVYVSWAPAASGGAPTAYTLQVSGALTASLPMGTLRAASGTVGAGSYTLSVVASNACGASAGSTPVTVVVP